MTQHSSTLGGRSCVNDACFFTRTAPNGFAATPYVQGAWNQEEQHIAPALGLIAHAIEANLRDRRSDKLKLGRISYDILGTIPIAEVTIDVGVLRPGRTIELVEARLSHNGRLAVLARAWLMQAFDTATIAGTSFTPIAAPEALEPWDMSTEWAGAFIKAMDVRRGSPGHGRATAWARTTVNLIGNECVSDTARTLGMVDLANGLGLRLSPEEAVFPNIDLTVHLFSNPDGDWLGFDTSVSVGLNGIGVTHSILHDQNGPFGTVMQCLTVRPEAAPRASFPGHRR